MKYLLLLLFLFFFNLGNCQLGYPIFQQKTINTFIYNPALAGANGGNFTLLYKSVPVLEESSFNTTYLHAHLPIINNSGGVGINFYSDKYGLTNSIYGSIGGSYHINFSSLNRLSIGLSGNFNRMQLNEDRLNDNVDLSDILLFDYNSNFNYDFSFGLAYKSKYFSIGGAVNQFNSLLKLYENQTEVNAFYNAYMGIHLPVFNGRDRLEPLISYRVLSSVEGDLLANGRYDIGAYYTFKDLFTLGGSYGNNGLLGVIVGFNYKNIYLEYDFEDIGGNNFSQKSTANSFILRYNFKQISNRERFTESRPLNRDIITSQKKSYKSINGNIRFSKKPNFNTKSLFRDSKKKPEPTNKKLSISKNLNSFNTVKSSKKQRKKSEKRKRKQYRFKR